MCTKNQTKCRLLVKDIDYKSNMKYARVAANVSTRNGNPLYNINITFLVDVEVLKVR
jgi:hypothetical protein